MYFSGGVLTPKNFPLVTALVYTLREMLISANEQLRRVDKPYPHADIVTTHPCLMKLIQ